MEPTPARRRTDWTWALVVAALGTCIRFGQLGHSLAGDHAFRQTQTAFAIREYAEHGIHLLHSPLPVFGSATDVPMEFPLFQAFARVFMLFGLDSSSAGRTAGLVAFQAAALLWWAVLRRWHGTTLATTTLVMMEVLPYGLHWGASSLIDFFSVALGLTAVLGLDIWLRSTTRARWVAAACATVATWLLFVVKVTTVPAVGVLALISFALAVHDLGWPAVRGRALALAGAAPTVGVVALIAWTHHADRIKANHVATEFLTSASLQDWNFGGSRSDLSSWHSVVGWAGGITGVAAGVAVIGALVGAFLGDRRTRLLVLGLVCGTLAPIAIFFNLFVIHSYYQITLYPLLVALGALAAVEVMRAVRGRSAALLALPLALLVAWLVSAASSSTGRHDIDQFLHESPIAAQVGEVNAVVPRHGRLVTIGCDWDPELMYFTDRSGLMLRIGTRAQVDAIWRQNDVARYRYLVTCDASVRAEDYLPDGVRLDPTAAPDVFRLRSSRR